MGRYNPDLPRILGQEWVPIREENVVFNQVNNNTERGYTFSVEAPRTLSHGKFYINKFPEAFFKEEVMTMSIYPQGTENRSGPIRSVVIPCNNGGITGASGFPNVFTFRRATGMADALMNPSDNRYLEVDLSQISTSYASMFFAVNQYAQMLQGKRILGVNLLYSAQQLINGGGGYAATCQIVTPTGSNTLGVWEYPALFSGPTYPVKSNWRDKVINRIALGDTNLYFGTTTTAANPPVNVVPWTYSELQRFELSNANPYSILILGASGGAVDVWSLDYMALEVVFCEENRVAVGSTAYNISILGGGVVQFNYLLGGNSITLRDPVSLSLNPVLNPGTNYSLMLSQSNLGDAPLIFGNSLGQQPQLNFLRELYDIPTLPGVEVTIPFPPTEDITGQVFKSQSTHIIPQLSLHASGGALINEVHAYGRQSVAQVYGNITANQDILDDPLTPTANYPWPQVRYYARRFGDTVVPLRLSTTTPTVTGAGFVPVYLTPQQWDALPEIVDGWKEVTLRFPVAPIMTGNLSPDPKWVWSATGESAGNRWEVLGANAPYLSGAPGNSLNIAGLYTLGTSVFASALGPTTYGTPNSGATVDEDWMPGWSPPVSGTTDDPASDAVLLFSQDMPTITGMSVVTLSQPVSGIGQNCGINPIFIPSAISYNQITWPYQVTDGFIDVFSRVLAGSWGTSTSGQTWSLGVPAQFSTNGSVGQVQALLANNYYLGVALGTSYLNQTGSYRIASSIAASGSDHWGAVAVRSSVSTTDQLYIRTGFEVDGSVKLYLASVTTNVHTTLASQTFAGLYVPGTFINVKFDLNGIMFQAKAWVDGDTEPVDWMLMTSITANTGAGLVGVRVIMGANSPVPTVSFDNIIVRDSTFGMYELQRKDTVDTDWKTIMSASTPTISGFNDFEARIGLLSSYRIRGVNVRDFAGAWSPTVTATIPAPGVSGSQIVATSNIMLFSSNERQTGAINLAYANAWEGNVVEDFTFPEAGFEQLQTMYNKDYFTAFRPSERGGQRFQRTLLVQAAAIAPPTLGDFTSLRDMAWADVNYVCVRDQEGNRWFATVLVPNGSVRRFRKLYMANVDIIEVTTTPTPVDPT